MRGVMTPEAKNTVPSNSLALPALPNPPSEADLRAEFIRQPALTAEARREVLALAHTLATEARQSRPAFAAEQFMALYKLSMPEGRMLMELAEALLRVPDVATRDFLIKDKIAPGHWLNADSKGFLSSAKYALQIAGKITQMGDVGVLQSTMVRLGMPTIRHAVQMAMRHLANQFVFAETIDEAVDEAAKQVRLFSFDMLGEAARSAACANRYFAAYEATIHSVGNTAQQAEVNLNNGVSVKLSALSCRFRTRYWQECGEALCGDMLHLAKLAKGYNIPLTIDAEEAGRLQPTLAVFSYLLNHPDIKGWQGLGIVVQAYGRRAEQVIDCLEDMARHNQTCIAVRLVKGAYWDSEIKIAQEKGLGDFPVYTEKLNTDLAYLSHARRLLAASKWFYPQFASHNAFTLAAVMKQVEEIAPAAFEIQKLYGMGDAIHEGLKKRSEYRLRTYAPVGRHDDLLAYLVRRLLENGANSSFMNKLADLTVAVKDLFQDPYENPGESTPIATGTALFLPHRQNSRGFDDDDAGALSAFQQMISGGTMPPPPKNADADAVSAAFQAAVLASTGWQRLSYGERANHLDRIADVYERTAASFYQLLVREAGKTFDDAVGELREAVDFCRYYAAAARRLDNAASARGIALAISPWNFPLAIFTGQIVAALVTGNCVIAKAAEQTPRVARLAVGLMYDAGIPIDVLQLLCGDGTTIGNALIAYGGADMVVFTGSSATAKIIETTIAKSVKPQAPLIAETGGINAMIIDASALIERAVDDIVMSAFRSAGQRCSALRMLYVQEEIAQPLIAMLSGAATALQIGASDNLCTDLGPVIDKNAKTAIAAHIKKAELGGRVIWQGVAPTDGNYCPPVIIRVSGIADLESEIFGPVLHVATYPAGGEAAVVDAINAKGYGLTFAMHSRIDASIGKVAEAIEVGNIYINRNQIGAVVGSQPFGGEGLSGTGPKAGGALYLKAFLRSTGEQDKIPTAEQLALPGPDGEDNQYTKQARGVVLVVHPDVAVSRRLEGRAQALGNRVILATTLPANIDGIDAVMTQIDGVDIGTLRRQLANASRRIIPLITDEEAEVWLQRECHICRDLTASGGNLALLSR